MRSRLRCVGGWFVLFFHFGDGCMTFVFSHQVKKFCTVEWDRVARLLLSGGGSKKADATREEEVLGRGDHARERSRVFDVRVRSGVPPVRAKNRYSSGVLQLPTGDEGDRVGEKKKVGEGGMAGVREKNSGHRQCAFYATEGRCGGC